MRESVTAIRLPAPKKAAGTSHRGLCHRHRAACRPALRGKAACLGGRVGPVQSMEATTVHFPDDPIRDLSGCSAGAPSRVERASESSRVESSVTRSRYLHLKLARV